MSVDYYACSVCGESKYEEYVGDCQGCGQSLCTSCLVNSNLGSRYASSYGYTFDEEDPDLMAQYEEEGFDLTGYEDGDTIDDSSIAKCFCPYCSGDVVNDQEVFAYIVKKYNIDVSTEWKELKSKLK